MGKPSLSQIEKNFRPTIQ